MSTGMRADPSMTNRGVYNSPHINIPMKGDASKIDPLVGENTISGNNNNIIMNAGYQMSSSITMPEATNNIQVSPIGLPQARQTTDTIFREPQQQHTPTTSWSNVVSSTNNFPTRSTSGETLLTSNIANQQQSPFPETNFHYYLNEQSRSHSFEPESPSNNGHHFPKSLSFGVGKEGEGMPPFHPGHSSYRDKALQSPRTLMTEQTSPMSSPPVSPYVSPSMNPRHGGDGQPPHWHLSDTKDYHPETSSSHHHRLHSMPQSIPEHPSSSSGHHHSHSYTSPPRHMQQQHSPSSTHHHHHHHHQMYPRRSGSKHPGSSPSSHSHRSSTEVLKTLLRKKACLYEPETSFAVSLVTWLVGRRLALAQGYFTRQQLQAGVHSCVTSKIDGGHVTRTKINRCMQVILNSCFHYIIPRSDGSKECGGEAYRVLFSREAADEEHLLRELSPPWNDLNLPSILTADDESISHSSLLSHEVDDEGVDHQHKTPNKGSSSVASDSLDSGSRGKPRSDSLDSGGGKRSVLLCFNENIRSASDVFRCHNEFIRDVAHTGNLNLSPEDWQSFFSGKTYHRKRGTGSTPPSDSNSPSSRYFHLSDLHDRMDQQGLSKLRTSWCAKRYEHDHSFCAFAHVDVNRGWLRRDPFLYNYKPIMCPYVKPLQNSEDCYVNMCPHGVQCDHAHSKEEVLYHPNNYKRSPCRNPAGVCPLGDICPNTHTDGSAHHQSHYSHRQGKYSPSRAAQHTGPKKKASASAGHGFDKSHFPHSPPMLYIEPAPLSEFEKTLLLPGLQALFRDHSSSVVYSTQGSYEYGVFGWRYKQVAATNNQTSQLPIGKVN